MINKGETAHNDKHRSQIPINPSQLSVTKS